METKIKILLSEFDLDFLNNLEKKSLLDNYISECKSDFELKFQKHVKELGRNFVLHDEAEVNYFESIENQIITNYFLLNK